MLKLELECPSCLKSSLVRYSDNSNIGLPVYHCRECELYISGRSPEEMKEAAMKIYDGEYWDERGAVSAMESNYDDSQSRRKLTQWKSQVEYCKRYLDGKKSIFEIGSGPGHALYWFEQMGLNVTGIEPDKRNVELINRKLQRGKCIAGYAEDMEIDGKYDIIWISHVFEHLIRPDLLLKKLRNNLDGFLFIEVPDCSTPEVLHSSIHENPSTYHFTRKSLVKIAQIAGYEVVLIDSMSFPHRPVEHLNRWQKRLHRFMYSSRYKYYPYFTVERGGQSIRTLLR